MNPLTAEAFIRVGDAARTYVHAGLPVPEGLAKAQLDLGHLLDDQRAQAAAQRP